MKTHDDCIFCKIAGKKIPSKLLYEDDHVVVFPDIHPRAPKHLLVVPKLHLLNLTELEKKHRDLAAALLLAAAATAREQGLSEGWRLVANNGADAGQEVMH